jgi:pilus assembly protein Flp/PilA
MLQRFMADRKGATAIEYALLVALIGIVMVGALNALGLKMYNLIGNAATAIH